MTAEERVLVVRRDAEAAKCSCGGYAERVTSNAEERKRFGCYRDESYECCARAFVCGLCGKRFGAQAEAPEME